MIDTKNGQLEDQNNQYNHVSDRIKIDLKSATFELTALCSSSKKHYTFYWSSSVWLSDR